MVKSNLDRSRHNEKKNLSQSQSLSTLNSNRSAFAKNKISKEEETPYSAKGQGLKPKIPSSRAMRTSSSGQDLSTKSVITPKSALNSSSNSTRN